MQDPNRYEVKDYDTAGNYLDMYDRFRSSKPPIYITITDHTADDAPNDAPTASAVPEPSEPSSTQRPPKRPHEAVGVELPDPELLRLHAALTGVLRMSGAAGVFKLIMERQNPGNPPVPSADGEAFMKEIIDPELRDLREAVANLDL